MNEEEFEKFKDSGICSDEDLMKLTEEQVNEVANSRVEVKSWAIDRMNTQRKVWYANKKSQR